MNTSVLKFNVKNKCLVTYKSHSFKCDQPDKNATYQCVHVNCGAHIVTDDERKKIISSNLEHMNHTPIAQRLRSKTKTKDDNPNLNSSQKKRVSFSLQPVFPSKPKKKATVNLKDNKDVKDNNKSNKKSSHSELPTGGAPSSNEPTLPAQLSVPSTSINIPNESTFSHGTSSDKISKVSKVDLNNTTTITLDSDIHTYCNDTCCDKQSSSLTPDQESNQLKSIQCI